MMRHFLEVDDLSPKELLQVLDLAESYPPEPVLAGLGVALIFEKPSNRTRNSSEMAVVGLGGHPVVIRGEEVGLGIREPVDDVVRVLARVSPHGRCEGLRPPCARGDGRGRRGPDSQPPLRPEPSMSGSRRSPDPAPAVGRPGGTHGGVDRGWQQCGP